MDLTQAGSLVWALAPEVVLSVAGILVLLAGAKKKAATAGDFAMGRGSSAGWFTLFGILVAAAANGWLYGLAPSEGGGPLVLDPLRLYANWLLLAAAFGTVLISFGYNYRMRLQSGEYHALILFATVGMMLMVGAGDLMLLFLGLEVMSISVYAMAAIDRRSRESAEAGIKYFLLGAFSTGFLLYGIALVYGATGSVELNAVSAAIAEGSANRELLVLGILLLLVGFAFKIAAVPFHMWTPDVYEGSPAPVTAWMSTAVKAAAFVAFLRVFFGPFGGEAELWQPVLWWLALITMVAANLIALAQENVKRMLAYSSIAHAGYLLVAMVAGNPDGAGALLFYLLIYTVMNIGAFALVITVSHHSEERMDIDDYRGFGRTSPVLAVLLTIFLLSLAGFPGTGGFMGKIVILQAAGAAELWPLAIALVLTTVVSYWYYLRLAWKMWMDAGEDGLSTTGSDPSVASPLAMRFALAACALVVLYAGVFAGGLLEFARESVSIISADL